MSRFIFVAASALVLLSVNIAFSEPFALKVDPPAGIKSDSPDAFGVQVLKASKVPDKSEVGVPPYPGAKIIQTRDGMPMEVNGEKVSCLKYVKLLTPDDPAQVEGFYKKQLTGHKFKSEFGGMIRIFWEGPADIDAMDMAKMCTTPNVLISETGNLYKALMPDGRTTIEITY